MWTDAFQYSRAAAMTYDLAAYNLTGLSKVNSWNTSAMQSDQLLNAQKLSTEH